MLTEKDVIARLHALGVSKKRGLLDIAKQDLTKDMRRVLIELLPEVGDQRVRYDIVVLLGSRTPPKMLRDIDAFGAMVKEFWRSHKEGAVVLSVIPFAIKGALSRPPTEGERAEVKKILAASGRYKLSLGKVV